VINFAPIIRCLALVHLGLADDVCPPETGLALYTALTCPKQLLTMEGCAHDAGAYFFAENVRRFLAEHLHPVAAG
jgi:cephalosporin-C deacetylase